MWKKCFIKQKNEVCEQDNCGKAKNNDKLDDFQIMSVMVAKNDVEFKKALECVICFEEYNLEVNKAMALNYCGQTNCSS